MFVQPPKTLDASGLRIGIAVSRYHREITDSMRQAAIGAFTGAGGRECDLTIVPASGAFELSTICHALAMLSDEDDAPLHDAVVAIGCVISGQTTHDQHIARAVSQGLTQIALETGVPVAFGVLTCQTIEQARARSIDAAARGSVNKGAEAMTAAIETARTLQTISKLGVSR